MTPKWMTKELDENHPDKAERAIEFAINNVENYYYNETGELDLELIMTALTEAHRKFNRTQELVERLMQEFIHVSHG